MKRDEIKNYISNPRILFFVLGYHGLLNWIPDRQYLKIAYRLKTGNKLNLQNPQTFNEKLQWLKLYDRRPEYTTMVDKYEAKKYVASIIGEEYIIPTLGVWDRFEDIDFDKLPDQFVLKCTHDSGGLVICRDKSKLDIEAARKKINTSLKCNYYCGSREWPYKNVKPRIIAEKYIGNDLIDYRFYCFCGEPHLTYCYHNKSIDSISKPEPEKCDIYDIQWNPVPYHQKSGNTIQGTTCPQNYLKMISFAKQLSKSIPYLRVDFYETDNRTYVGELTFFPGGGTAPFFPMTWDKTLGNWLKLPDHN